LGESRVLDADAVQDRGVQFVQMHGRFDDVVGKVVRLAEVVTLTITARVKVPVPAGAETVDNVVTATDDGSVGPDATPENNTASDSDRLLAAPDLYVLKTDGLAAAKVGQQITYTITGGNAGDQTAGGVVITDTLPPGLRFIAASGGGRLVGAQVVWNLGDLAPGATFQVTVTVLAEAPAGGKVAVNNVTITDRFGGSEDPTPLNNLATDPTNIAVANAFAFDGFNNLIGVPGEIGKSFKSHEAWHPICTRCRHDA